MTTRKLTPGEIAMARLVYKDSLDYDSITVSDERFAPLQSPGTAMAPNGHLYMYGCYRADYSAGNLQHKTLFIHEMGHVWQKQNRVLNPIITFVKLNLTHKFNYAAAYAYTLEPGKDLLAYNMEQQASIIEEYFELVHGGHNSRYAKCRNNLSADGKKTLYAQVLEKFLKNPSYPRGTRALKKSSRKRLSAPGGGGTPA